MNIAAVLLAAGEARRFGGPKQVAQFQGAPLIDYPLAAARDAGLAPRIVVTGAHATRVDSALPSDVQIVHNPDWPLGMATSIRAGIRALPSATNAALLLLADQPRVTAAHLRALVEARRLARTTASATAYRSGVGVPALFTRALFGDLLALQGDRGAAKLLRALPRCASVRDPAVCLDIDRPCDLKVQT